VAWAPPSREARSLSLLWLTATVCALLLRPLWVALAAFSPACPFREWTNIPCLSCGTTRSAVELLSGNLAEALAYNPLAAAGGAVFVIGGVAAPLWIAAGGRIPEIPSPLPVRWRLLAAGVLAANWVYLIVRGV